LTGNIKMSRKHHTLSPEKFTPTEDENQNNPWLKLGKLNQFPCARAGPILTSLRAGCKIKDIFRELIATPQATAVLDSAVAAF